jgi:hypothetical protein
MQTRRHLIEQQLKGFEHGVSLRNEMENLCMSDYTQIRRKER